MDSVRRQARPADVIGWIDGDDISAGVEFTQRRIECACLTSAPLGQIEVIA